MELDRAKLKRYMAIKFMTGSDLARATGISKQSIYRILRGENEPKPQNLRLICEVLECGPLDLLKEA